MPYQAVTPPSRHYMYIIQFLSMGCAVLNGLQSYLIDHYGQKWRNASLRMSGSPAMRPFGAPSVCPHFVSRGYIGNPWKLVDGFCKHTQSCGEPPRPRGSVVGLIPPGLEFRIVCLEGSVISLISPSSGGFPCSIQPICAQKWPKARFISFCTHTSNTWCRCAFWGLWNLKYLNSTWSESKSPTIGHNWR